MKKIIGDYQKIIRLIWLCQKSVLFYTVAFAITSVVWSFSGLWLSALVINGLVAKASFQTLSSQVFFFLLIIFAIGALNAWLDKKRDDAASALGYQIDEISNLKLLEISYFQLQDPEFREEYQRATDASQYNGGMYQLVNTQFASILNGLVALVLGLIFLVKLGQMTATVTSSLGSWTNSWSYLLLLVLVILLPMGINFLAAIKKARFEKENFEDNVKTNNQAGYLINTLADYENGPVMRLYQAGKLLGEQYQKWQKVIQKNGQKMINRQLQVEGSANLLTSILNVAVYLLVVLKAYFGALAVGSVILYAGYFIQMTSALSEMFASFGRANTYVPILSFYYDFMYKKATTTGTLPVEKRNDNEYEIEFHDVSFQYPGSEEWILRHLNLKLTIGEKLALVGRNGSGKSTIVKLLTRLYPATSGVITLNGIDINKYDLNEYQSILAVVFQDFKLFSFSVAENVAASHQPDKKRVAEALYIAGVDQRVAQMPQGSATTLYKDLDPTGVEISGGEAQKIAIARAWYRDAPFVVLDEPTSALDPFSEFEVYRRFDELVQDKTSIYISHRMSSTRFADKIIVLADGEIKESGNHASLLAQNGLYAELFNAQAAYYTEQLAAQQAKTLFA